MRVDEVVQAIDQLLPYLEDGEFVDRQDLEQIRMRLVRIERDLARRFEELGWG